MFVPQLLAVVEQEAEEGQVVPRLRLREWGAQVGHMAEAAGQEAIVFLLVHILGKELVERAAVAQSA